MSDNTSPRPTLAHFAFKGAAFCGAELTGGDPTDKPMCSDCATAAFEWIVVASADRDRLARIVADVEALVEAWMSHGVGADAVSATFRVTSDALSAILSKHNPDPTIRKGDEG
jgi:hypothetical protein